MMTSPLSPALHPHGSPTSRSTDIKATSTAKAKALGATIMKDVMDVMGHGQMRAVPHRPCTGAALALWQPAAKSA